MFNFEPPKYTNYKICLFTGDQVVAEHLKTQFIKAIGSDGNVLSLKKDSHDFVFHKGNRDFYILEVEINEHVKYHDIVNRTSLTEIKHLII